MIVSAGAMSQRSFVFQRCRLLFSSVRAVPSPVCTQRPTFACRGADYLVFEVEGWSIIADAWSRVLREVLLFVFSFGYLWYVLRRRPETRGRFPLFGAGAPKLRRADVQRYLADAGWILIISYCDVIVSNVSP